MIDATRVAEILNTYTYVTPTVRLPLLAAVGRVLREELRAKGDSPPFDKAAMDGYALRSHDLGGGSGAGEIANGLSEFAIIGRLGAGDVPQAEVGPGQCVQIMTGAMMPAGADKVVRVEYTERVGDRVRITQAEPNINVIYAGENRKAGELVLSVPCKLRPQDIAVLASHGISEVLVAEPVRVGVISTGSELLSPGEPPAPGKIYDSNAYQIAAYCAELGLPYINYGTVGDDPDAIRQTYERALAENDMVISSGGVSMGEFDYVPSVLREIGAELLFHSIAFKPGKSTLFARRGNTCVFGLAGNPAASVVLFRVLVEPTLYRMMGLEPQDFRFRGTLREDIRRSGARRKEFRPAFYHEGQIQTLRYGGSSHMDAFADANCVIELDVGVTELKAGEEIYVRPL
ncbi:MAG: molybdopterin molybdotransferase MoeA [Spirochaeta sp.]|nr:molybdopterin molybdotransferase MoeA [Spirochaeta sp.]